MPNSFQATVQGFLEAADQAATSDAHGDVFEELVTFVFLQVPGLSNPQRKRINKVGSEEIDIAFWNDGHPQGLSSAQLDFIVPIECKNWSQPVGSRDVDWFRSKLERRSRKFGILVAARGITGQEEDRSAAWHIVAGGLARGIHLVILTRDDIEALDSGIALVALIRTKLQQLVVGGPI